MQKIMENMVIAKRQEKSVLKALESISQGNLQVPKWVDGHPKIEF